MGRSTALAWLLACVMACAAGPASGVALLREHAPTGLPPSTAAWVTQLAGNTGLHPSLRIAQTEEGPGGAYVARAVRDIPASEPLLRVTTRAGVTPGFAADDVDLVKAAAFILLLQDGVPAREAASRAARASAQEVVAVQRSQRSGKAATQGADLALVATAVVHEHFARAGRLPARRAWLAEQLERPLPSTPDQWTPAERAPLDCTEASEAHLDLPSSLSALFERFLQPLTAHLPAEFPPSVYSKDRFEWAARRVLAWSVDVPAPPGSPGAPIPALMPILSAFRVAASGAAVAHVEFQYEGSPDEAVAVAAARRAVRAGEEVVLAPWRDGRSLLRTRGAVVAGNPHDVLEVAIPLAGPPSEDPRRARRVQAFAPVLADMPDVVRLADAPSGDGGLAAFVTLRPHARDDRGATAAVRAARVAVADSDTLMDFVFTTELLTGDDRPYTFEIEQRALGLAVRALAACDACPGSVRGDEDTVARAAGAARTATEYRVARRRLCVRARETFEEALRELAARGPRAPYPVRDINALVMMTEGETLPRWGWRAVPGAA
ncbi:unnamed protein product [Pedinophyceae sp. YPF-701]|nr:unnamed protein product [Pedinophyceae sp. YPF-701]